MLCRSLGRWIIALTFLLFSSYAHAATIELTNGDRITGDLISETMDEITIHSEMLGEVVIDKQYVKVDEPPPAVEEKKGPKWNRHLTLGYRLSRGNTEKSSFLGKITVSRKSDRDEWQAKLNSYIASSDKKEDAREYTGMLRYAYSFGSDMKWYHFMKLEGEQDRFSNIDYRLIPATGVGYWFRDKENFKVMAEAAFGFEHTHYRDSTDSDSEGIFVPRGFLEMPLFGSLKFREDVTLYPSLSDFGEYRLHSQTDLINPINDQMSLKLSLIDDFDSDPAGSTKKNDVRFITSLDYAF